MKDVFSKTEDSDGLLLRLARPPAYVTALMLYAVAVCVAGVFAHGRRAPLVAFYTVLAVVKEAVPKGVETVRASLRFVSARRD